MSSAPKKLLIAAAALLFAVVGVQTVLPFVPEPGRLRGFVEDARPPGLSWGTIRTGALAKWVETWFAEHIGFRRFWVGLDNQVTYTFFGDTRPVKNDGPNGTRITVGAHDWFFEHHYIEYATRNTGRKAEEAERAVALLKSVQAKLDRRGIPLLLVVAPSKAEVYPEHFPPEMLARKQPGQFTTMFEKMRPILKASGVRYYDGPERFLAWKAAGQRNLFARSGSHWSYIAALQVLQDLRAELNPRMKRPIPEFAVAATPMGKPRRTDLDLLDLANLLVDAPYAHPIPYPELVAQAAVPTDNLPRILWVHDSFGWVLFELLYEANAIQPTETLYYFSKHALGMPGQRSLDLDPQGARWIPSAGTEDPETLNPRLKPALDAVDWEALLKPYDAVVVVWTEIAADFNGWGLLETLDRALD